MKREPVSLPWIVGAFLTLAALHVLAQPTQTVSFQLQSGPQRDQMVDAVCEQLRLQESIAVSEWSTSACAALVFTDWVVRTHADMAAGDAGRAGRDAREAALNEGRQLLPKQQGARCGDDRVQPEAGEECDDGNRRSGDGCSATCKNES